MGLWSGIKHALNSTLGTSGFKPLDQLINENTNTKTTAVQTAITGSTQWSRINTLYTRGCIKSVQSGTITITDGAIYNTATITAVTLNKAILLYNGAEASHSNNLYDTFSYSNVRLRLTNTTTVRADIGKASNSSDILYVSFQVVEFY